MKRLLFFVTTLILAVVAFAENTPKNWSKGRPAAGTAQGLVALEPLPLIVTEFVATKVTEETAIFYFSPTCFIVKM